ncbi:putative aminohydrolase SsnA [Candidatus Bipolaricaulota bacterium]|nr:putative aminohydrolase SsnA [Candidatus Bipolaricaulota bacterium]
MTYLLYGGKIWDNDGSVIQNGAVVIKGDEIVTVDRADKLEQEDYDRTIDCSDKLIIPGLVNAHTHIYSTLSRGLVLPDNPPENFLEILTGLWWKLDRNLTKETIQVSALVAGLEFLKNGVTTVFDHHSSPGATPGSLEIIRDGLVDELGVRSSLCYEVSDRNGKDETDLGIRENLDWLSHVSNSENHMVGGQFGLHASFTLSTNTLEEIASYVEDLDTGVHIHLAEGLEDQQNSLSEYGTRVVNRLDSFGLLRPDSMLVHGIHLAETEKNILAKRAPFIVYNPRSNMNNAVGVADLPGMFRRGIDVGLGNDGMGFDMITEFQAGYFLQKIFQGRPDSIGLPLFGNTLFQNNYELAEETFGVKLGKIVPGYKADIAILDYQAPTPLTQDNVLGHLVYGFSGNNHPVASVFVAGKPVVEDYEVVGVNENEVYKRAQNLARSLWESVKSS